MNETKEKIINRKLDELRRNLKVDTTEKNWENKINKEFRIMTINHKISRIVSFIFVGGFAILGLIALIVDGGSLLGIEIKEQYLYVSILVTSISTIIINVGNMQLKMDRIKTLLFLNDLNKP